MAYPLTTSGDKSPEQTLTSINVCHEIMCCDTHKTGLYTHTQSHTTPHTQHTHTTHITHTHTQPHTTLHTQHTHHTHHKHNTHMYTHTHMHTTHAHTHAHTHMHTHTCTHTHAHTHTHTHTIYTEWRIPTQNNSPGISLHRTDPTSHIQVPQNTHVIPHIAATFLYA